MKKKYEIVVEYHIYSKTNVRFNKHVQEESLPFDNLPTEGEIEQFVKTSVESKIKRNCVAFNIKASIREMYVGFDDLFE